MNTTFGHVRGGDPSDEEITTCVLVPPNPYELIPATSLPELSNGVFVSGKAHENPSKEMFAFRLSKLKVPWHRPMA